MAKKDKQDPAAPIRVLLAEQVDYIVWAELSSWQRVTLVFTAKKWLFFKRIKAFISPIVDD